MDEFRKTPAHITDNWKSTNQHFNAIQFLSVEDSRRLRASSDPGGLHICIVPEITITCDDGREGDCTDENETDTFLIPPQQRPRSNTCPEEMFRNRKGRPPTPPPDDVQKTRTPSGKRFSFNFGSKDINGISFAQHRLSKVHEEMSDRSQRKPQARKLSLQTNINVRFCAPVFSQDKKNSVNKTDNSPFQLDSSAKSLSNDAIDSSVCSKSDSQINSLENNHNSEQHIPNNAETIDVVMCTSGPCRSKTDGRDNVDNDHLIAY